MPSARRRQILILGGGFAGLAVSLELEKSLGRDPSVEITLVNRENFSLFTPMLHEVAASDLDLTARGGKSATKRAVVAVARKLTVLLHRLWVSGEVYEPLRNSQKAIRAAA